MTTDKHIDDAIDRAVREMMDVEPAAGLRRRVLARLERPQHRWQWAPRLAFAVAALALVATAAWMLVRDSRGPAPAPVQTAATRPEATSTAPPPPPAATPRAPALDSPGAQRLTPPRSVAPRRESALRDRVVAAVATEPDASEPAEQPPAIELQVAPIDVGSVVITPLAPIAPLRIDPLPPGTRR